MDIFLLAAIFAAAFTMLVLVSVVEPIGQRLWFRLRTTLRVTAPRRAVQLLYVTLACIFIVMIFLVTLISFGPLHPRGSTFYTVAEWISSQRFFSLVLGFLFGIFLIFWVRQLVLLQPDDKVTWLHKGEAVFLVLLLLAGTFSEYIGSFARRLTQFSAGGITLTFEALKGTGSGVDRGQPGQGGSSRSNTSGNALYLLSGFHGEKGILARDRRYVAILSSPTSTPAAENNLAEDFFGEVGGKMAACLVGVVSETRDDAEVNTRLGRLKPILREIMLNRGLSGDRIGVRAEHLVDDSMNLVGDLRWTYLARATQSRGNIVSACKDLVVLRCPTVDLTFKSADDQQPLIGIDRCLSERAAQTANGGRSDAARKLEATMNRAFVTPGVGLFEKPYLALYYASLLWRLGDFDAAAAVLENWIKDTRLPAEDPATKWYVIRLRTALTVVLEEWVRSTDGTSPLLISHHLSNVLATITLMGRERAITEAFKALSTDGFDVVGEDFSKPTWSASCALLDDDRATLASTYLSQLLVYSYRGAQNPDYFDKNSSEVIARRDSMMKLNLGCRAKTPAELEQITLLYAEALQIYGEVEIASAVRIARIPDAAAATRRLTRACKAARLGLDILKNAAGEIPLPIATIDDLLDFKNQKVAELKYLLDRIERRAQEAGPADVCTALSR